MADDWIAKLAALQALEVARRRKRRRLISAIEMGLATTLLVAIVIVLLMPFLTEEQVAISLALDIAAGIVAALSMYHSEEIPVSYTGVRVFAEVAFEKAADFAQLGEDDKTIVEMLAEKGFINVGEMANLLGITPAVVIQRLIDLETKGFIKIRGVG